MSRLFITFMLITSIAAFTACSDKKPVVAPASQPPMAAAPASTQATPAVTLPQKEEAKAEKEVYIYDAKGRRDPFGSLVETLKKKPQRKKGATTIENFDIDEIKLVAIAWDKNQYFALITLPDNKSYTIRKGATLGINGGKVIEITKNSILVREQLTDYKGQPKVKDTIMKLRKEGDE